MAFSAADLERVAAEARPALCGGIVRSVRPRGREGFALAVRRGEETRWFVAVLEAPVARAHLAARPAEEREALTPFHEKLRSRLEGATVEDVAAVPGDRVLEVRFARGGERVRLWLSFFGARADAAIEDASTGDLLLGLRPGSGRPLLTRTDGAPRPPLFPDVAADPATAAYSRALAAHFEAIEAEEGRERRRRAVAAELVRRRRKAEGAAKRLGEAIAESAGADDAQRQGELLLASPRLLKRGASSVEVPDYFAGAEAPPRRIELDPARGPREQAERYFKRAKKLRRAAVVAVERLARFEAEIARIGRALSALEGGADAAEAAALAGVPAAGIGPVKQERPARGPVGGGPRRFRSRDGLEILVGRSNEENDRLTMRTARSHDVFLHVLGFPGSHVIVRVERGKTAPLETLLDAAALAVHYSKARDHGRAEVSYAPRKWVRKPRGGKPGLVTLDRSETLQIIHDAARLKRVLGSAADDAAEPGRAEPRPI